MDVVTNLASAAVGIAIGVAVGLLGGGGSVLAVPLLVYIVGEPSVHVAIGTSAVAVCLLSLRSLLAHARAGNVQWRAGLIFGAAGVAGAFGGAALAQIVDGRHLLILLGAMMTAVGARMFATRHRERRKGKLALSPNLVLRLVLAGSFAGFISGFFGISGGVVIVPALVLSAGMATHAAVGTSVGIAAAFAAATSVSYAASGLVDWPVAGLLTAAGIAGTFAGLWLGRKLAADRTALTHIFAAVIGGTGLFIVVRELAALL